MALEDILTTSYPAYTPIPRELEERAYVWSEYARGDDRVLEGGEINRFVGGKMFFVKFGSGPRDPIWPVDVFLPQEGEAQTVLGCLLSDASDGFPVHFYPRCLQKAHENAALVDFDFDVLQEEVFAGLRAALGAESGPAVLLGIERMTIRSSAGSDAITVEATFGFTIVVDTSRGTPTIDLTVGSEVRRAVYRSGSGTSLLAFVYEAREEDDLRDVQVREGSFRLNGGTMRSGDYAIVEATVQETSAEGLTVELARSISGRTPRYNWKGRTDSAGHVILTVYSTDRSSMSGFYLGRARTADGRVVGKWSSIPLNSGFHHDLELVSGGGQRVVATQPLVAAKPVATVGRPVVSALDAIWPNPSNGATQIAYHLAAAGPVRLQVYNVLGQGVRALVDQVQPAGHYRVEWDGRDEGGAGTAAGVYIVGLHHRDGFAAERLLYLK